MITYRFLKITSTEDLNISYKIRKKVFCEEQKISPKIEFDNLDHLCEHFLISKDKIFIATARVRPKTENTFKIERVAVLPKFRRLKVGSLLINKIIETYLINKKEVKNIAGLKIKYVGKTRAVLLIDAPPSI